MHRVVSNMSTAEEIQTGVRKKQNELKKLTDDELMNLDIKLHESLKQSDQDPLLTIAVYSEVRRRSKAACWIWQRMSHRGRENCKKWLRHLEESEKAAKRLAQEIISKAHPGIEI